MGKALIVHEHQESLSLAEWHQRFKQQAGWSQAVRHHLFSKTKTNPNEPILEVGSGTGAILECLYKEIARPLSGIDIDFSSLAFAKYLPEEINLVQADGHLLPFANRVFSISICHYLLLWVTQPSHVLAEMVRVTRNGGWVIAVAEPDHQARIDYPPTLDDLGALQTRALREQGADTQMGRKLSQLFYQSGLKAVETGIMGGQWQSNEAADPDETEWRTLHADLAGLLSSSELTRYHRMDQESRETGQRLLFIPTFYAIGCVS